MIQFQVESPVAYSTGICKGQNSNVDWYPKHTEDKFWIDLRLTHLYRLSFGSNITFRMRLYLFANCSAMSDHAIWVLPCG